MHIVGYCYNAACYCPACTKADWKAKTLRYPRVLTIECLYRDEHDLPEHMRDEEGNPVSPIFDTSESEFTACDGCGETIIEYCTVPGDVVACS